MVLWFWKSYARNLNALSLPIKLNIIIVCYLFILCNFWKISIYLLNGVLLTFLRLSAFIFISISYDTSVISDKVIDG